ncbi:MAG: hypothetical protein J6R29_03235, partial [Clostridia bacterium]|nr:hypothetical protein [Clostridia bacterium]
KPSINIAGVYFFDKKKSQSSIMNYSNGQPRYLFDSENWEEAWTEKRNKNTLLGIILTDTTKAVNDEFANALNEYVDYKLKNGIEYVILDLKSQCVCSVESGSCEDLVDLLNTIYEVEIPDYLLIVGDDTVIPKMKWKNQSADDDLDVPSDLPYITLDTASPWSGVEYDFSNLTVVGRIPAIPENGFIHAINYFNNAKKFAGYNNATAFAYSAMEWYKTSQAEFSPIRPLLITSPDYTCNADRAKRNGLKLLGKLDCKYNLLCFNLHGTDSDHKWYGQLKDSYPDAFSQELLPKSDSGYVLMTEACYGARPLINKNGGQSIVVHALSNNCMGFVGSTRIAYGQANGHISCADVIANVFTESVAKGETCGQAFLLALDKLYKDKMNEAEIKTLAEFALYGDPSIVLVKSSSAKKVGNLALSKPKANSSLSISLYSCNSAASTYERKRGRFTLYTYSPERQEEYKTMAFSIERTSKTFMAKTYSKLSNEEPRVYKVVGREGYRAVYSKESGGVKDTVILHLDDSGKIKNIYTSK